MNNLALRFPLPALVCLLLLQSSPSLAKADDLKLVVFSRHTFRGTAKTLGPQRVSLAEYGIDIALPTLSYTESATSRGHEIAKTEHSQALQRAAAAAVDALDESKTFDGHWDEIRANLATERTYSTALYLREGLRALNPSANANTLLTGCPCEPPSAVDATTTKTPVLQCLNDAILKPLYAGSKDTEIYYASAQTFLDVLRSAIGATGTPPPIESKTSHEELARLASTIEMTASIAPPLPLLFKEAPADQLLQRGKDVMSAGTNMLGARFLSTNPAPLYDALSVFPLQYIASLQANQHTIVLTHDDVLSNLLHALGFISGDGDPNDLGIYPLESIVFAFGESSASVVRMTIKIEVNGAFTGEFAHRVIWKGTLAQWDEKVQAVNDRVQAWDVGQEARDCLNAIQICTAEPLDVLY